MKTLLRFVLVGLFIVFFVELSIADDNNFRKTKWGLSIAEVKSSEPLDVAEEDENSLAYKTKVIDKDVFLVYSFIDNQLVRAQYVLAESHLNKNDFITDYNDFKKVLSKKYGKPIQDKTVWKNDTYKDDYPRWGFAIGMGQLIYFSSWETQDTEISNLLMGDNFKISCIVRYGSKKLKEIEKKAQEKKALDAF